MDLDGSIIEEMIRQGQTIVDKAIVDYEPVAIIAAFSGGDDSIVTTHFAMQYIRNGAHVLHCNTGIGLQKTRRHVHDVCHRFCWSLTSHTRGVSEF